MGRLFHSKGHMVHRIGWLRAPVLGANDGRVSTTSLVLGVAAAASGRPEILIAGLAGLVAGAMNTSPLLSSPVSDMTVMIGSERMTETASGGRARREAGE